MRIKRRLRLHNERSTANALREQGFATGEEAHVWYVSTAALAESVLCYYTVLSDDEKERAKRFHKLEDQHGYIVRQGVKRLILAAYVGCHPTQIEFACNRYGKPFVSNLSHTFEFSVTHSKNAAVMALSKGAEIGIDVEYMNATLDWRAIAYRFFPAHQLRHLESCLREVNKAALFFSYWTQMEAFLKARGLGLSGLNIENFKQGTTAMDYSIVPLRLGDRYQGSLAVRHTIRCVRLYAYTSAFASNLVV